MAYATPEVGGTALATLLGSAASAMEGKRFSRASAPDPGTQDHLRTILSGPFVVAAPEGNWPRGGNSFTTLMRKLGHDVDGRDVSHLKSAKAYVAHLDAYMQRAAQSVRDDTSPRRQVIRAAHAFVRLNARIQALGATQSRSDILRADVVSYIREYALMSDARVRAYCTFLFRAFPHWAKDALRPTKGE